MKLLLIAGSLGLCALLWAGCQTAATKGKANGTGAFFDLPAFFDGEIKRLESKRTGIIKTLTLNGKVEKIDIAAPDWRKELVLFLKIDLNKPAWREKYAVDTLAGGQQIDYMAKDEDLATRKLSIRKTGEQVKGIIIDHRQENQVYSSLQHLEYLPDSGYNLSISQQTAIGRENKYGIAVKWLLDAK